MDQDKQQHDTDMKNTTKDNLFEKFQDLIDTQSEIPMHSDNQLNISAKPLTAENYSAKEQEDMPSLS